MLTVSKTKFQVELFEHVPFLNFYSYFQFSFCISHPIKSAFHTSVYLKHFSFGIQSIHREVWYMLYKTSSCKQHGCYLLITGR